MFCSQCGATIMPEVKFCSSCGKETTQLVSEPASNSTGQSRSKFWTTKKVVLTIVGAIVGIAITTALRSGASNPFSGEVSLDVDKVETTIHDGILEQAGDDTTVECPSEMSGKPGDTRNCLVTDSIGQKFFVVVTFENSKGDISWVLE